MFRVIQCVCAHTYALSLITFDLKKLVQNYIFPHDISQMDKKA